jgi:hypothetical protein
MESALTVWETMHVDRVGNEWHFPNTGRNLPSQIIHRQGHDACLINVAKKEINMKPIDKSLQHYGKL